MRDEQNERWEEGLQQDALGDELERNERSEQGMKGDELDRYDWFRDRTWSKSQRVLSAI